MGEQRYIHSNEKDEVELNRLRLVEEIYDPTTIRHLEIIRASEGWNCLEVGAGAGSVAQWIATRVGPTGKVVATDIDTRFLRQISVPNLEIRQHDIIKDDLETSQYDLVHCRLLLMHLPEPEKGLKRMANALRPGGWLLIEEQDYACVLSADVTNPSAAIFTSTYRAGSDFLRKKGILDPYFGRRVRGLVEELGFIDVDQEGWTRVVGGDLGSFTLESVRQHLWSLQKASKWQGHPSIPASEEKLSTTTIRNHGRVLTSFSSWLQIEGYTESNVLSGLKILESFAARAPVISTNTGAEGIDC